MFAPQEGTSAALNGDNVVIHFVPKNTTVYNGIHWGPIDDAQLTRDLAFNADGTFDITLPKTSCGKALPVAPIKAKDGATTGDQYYLAIPAADKLPEDGQPDDEPLTISATVTISVAGAFAAAGNGSAVAALPVQATDLDGSGDVCIDEVLKAAHAAYHPDGSAGYASAVTQWGLGIDKLWGDESGNFGYYVDNAMAMNLSETVEAGGYVQAWVYQDAEYFSDSYAYFDSRTAAAKDGSITLTLFSASFDANWNPVFAPYAGAAVTVDGKSTRYVTDSDGKVTIRFDESGTYLISAQGKDGDILVPPVSRVSAVISGGDDEEASRVDLEVINNTGMFKGAYAYVETVGGDSTLVVALTGSTYRYLIPGSYAQAAASASRGNWIAGQQDKDGKWYFTLPLSPGQTYLPVVSVSQTYLDEYEAGNVPLERSYYPRQFELDLNARTLTVDDYNETLSAGVRSLAPTFRVAGSTSMHVVGGPNSNNYGISFSLRMQDSTYDQVTYPTVTGGSVGTATAALTGGEFAIDLTNAPKLTAFQDREPIEMVFRVSETGENVTLSVTIDLLARTIVIEGDDSGVVPAGDDEEVGSGSAAGAGTAVVTDVEVAAEVADGTAAASLDTKTVADALKKEDGADTLSVKVESKGAEAVELTLDAGAVKAVAEAGTALTVETEQGAVTLSGDALKKLAEEDGEVTVLLRADEDGSVTLDVTHDGEPADVELKAALPAPEDSFVLVLVKPDGTEEVVRKSLVEDGTAYALLPAGCTVRAEDRRMHFDDVGDNWFTAAVDFTSSHGLFIGVGESEFAPSLPMTRAMLATVLYRLESEPAPDAADAFRFDDVKEGSWYADAVKWAAAEGIFNGRENGFAPGESITRQEIATAIYRYVKSLGLDTGAKGSLAAFPDGDRVSDWAADAMTWAVSVGLFRGDDAGSLNPGSSATRAEIATLFTRLVKLLVR